MKHQFEEVKKIKISRAAEDLSSKRVGTLEVLYPCGHSGSKNNPRAHVMWLAECDSGERVKVRGNAIKSGSASSCGRCSHLDPRLVRSMEYVKKMALKEESTNEDPSPVLETKPGPNGEHEALDAIVSSLEDGVQRELPGFPSPADDADTIEETGELQGERPQNELAGPGGTALDVELGVIQTCSVAINTIDRQAARRVLNYLQARHTSL